MTGIPSRSALGFLAEIWANRWIKLVVFLLALGAAGWVVHLLWPIVKLFVIAVVLAYLFDPMADKLQRGKISRTMSTIYIALIVVLSLVAVLAWIVPYMISSVQQFAMNVPRYVEDIQLWAQPVLQRFMSGPIPQSLDEWRERLTGHEALIGNVLREAPGQIAAWIGGAFTGVAGFITAILSVIVVPVAWFYLLRDFDHLKIGAVGLVPEHRRGPVLDIAGEIDTVISNFMRGQFLVCLFLAFVYAVGLQFVAGIPLGFVIGLFAGLISFVPYLGMILGIGPALLLAFLEYKDVLHPALVVAVFSFGQFMEANVVTPRIMGEKLGLHPVTVIFAILIWGNLLGITGMIIAVPVTAVMSVFWRRGFRRYQDSRFYRFGAAKPET
ncbi:AI-2E family transporter [bacterium]|nr:AI-2E family transporter [bacterium]